MLVLSWLVPVCCELEPPDEVVVLGIPFSSMSSLCSGFFVLLAPPLLLLPLPPAPAVLSQDEDGTPTITMGEDVNGVAEHGKVVTDVEPLIRRVRMRSFPDPWQPGGCFGLPLEFLLVLSLMSFLFDFVPCDGSAVFVSIMHEVQVEYENLPLTLGLTVGAPLMPTRSTTLPGAATPAAAKPWKVKLTAQKPTAILLKAGMTESPA